AGVSPAAVVDRSVQVVPVDICLWVLSDER
ncbi:MAG: hypothetical protein ACI9HI_000998, partial [Salinirussus sp.]